MRTLERTEWRVAVGDEHTTAVFEPATEHRGSALFVCAHGAGGHMSDRGMLQVTSALRSRGIHVVRFNFLYTEKRSMSWRRTR
jgi:predicted alpha/beta-hydrolase family hydrolase